MSSFWYALRTKARKEDVVWRQVKTLGYDSYFPHLRVQPVNPRSRHWVPYFPGYFFICADLEKAGLSTFQWMPHSLGLVNFGGEPAVVSDHLIAALRRRVDEIAAAGGELYDGLHQGDVVWIREGPFKGFEAIFDIRLPGKERVRVLLELLSNQRSIPLELNSGQIQKLK
jgi:transcription antitermination factor NusG